jgi:hypothetical protein
MGKCEWIEMADAKKIAISLINEYDDKFGKIPYERLKFIGILNAKPPKEHNKIWHFVFIADPVNELLETDLAVIINFDCWSDMDEKAQAIVVASMLSCMECKERIVARGYDLHDSKSMVLNFGVDYETNPDIPDIINTHHHWR